jgi:hypothetical protein
MSSRTGRCRGLWLTSKFTCDWDGIVLVALGAVFVAQVFVLAVVAHLGAGHARGAGLEQQEQQHEAEESKLHG